MTKISNIWGADAQALLWTSAEKVAALRRERKLDRERQTRQRGSKKKRSRFPNLRKWEMQKLFAYRWGNILPNDSAGEGDLRVMADHLAQLGSPEQRIASWARVWAPWLTDDGLDTLIEQVGTGKHWKANALAKELNLDDATRTLLKIRTIGAVDVSKEKRAQRCREQEAAAARARRAKGGAAPHAVSVVRTKPWELLKISRRSYYRNRANGTVGTNSSGILLESQLPTKQCHTVKGAAPTGASAAAGWARCCVNGSANIVYDDRADPALETATTKKEDLIMIEKAAADAFPLSPSLQADYLQAARSKTVLHDPRPVREAANAARLFREMLNGPCIPIPELGENDYLHHHDKHLHAPLLNEGGGRRANAVIDELGTIIGVMNTPPPKARARTFHEAIFGA